MLLKALSLSFLAFGCTFASDVKSPEPSMSRESLDFFEAKIRPVLSQQCYRCHSAEAKAAMGGFRLDTRDAIRTGGQSGAAVVPNKPATSLILKALRYESPKMPPGGQLTDDVVSNFEKWIAMGAPDPREAEKVEWKVSTIDVKKGREFWAFQPVKKPLVPTGKNTWAKTDIDRIVFENYKAKGLTPVADADRRSLIRRTTFDLTGLPPTTDEVNAFVVDRNPKAFEKVVDRLLASPRYGERWGRHWLDVARFAESNGRTRNYLFPYAYKYRDYVIKAFNQDKPYDVFLKEQIAGDLLPSATVAEKKDRIVATGFLALGAHDLNEQDVAQYAMDVADEQINVLTRSVMGLTVGCARCHDHKFDPIPTSNYYAMAGIFRSTELRTGLERRPKNRVSYFQEERLITLPEEATIQPTPEQIAARTDLLEKKSDAERRLLQLQRRQAIDKVQATLQELRGIENQLDKLPSLAVFAMGATDAKTMVSCKVNLRGDPHKLGPEVHRGFVDVATPDGMIVPEIGEGQSGRLQLAEWLTNKQNPLPSRVMANRMWYQLFGRGIVRTVDNFGKMGEMPSNQKLLDFVAARFMDNGWSVKKTLREILLSRTYQLGADYNEANFNKDPDNAANWRMSRRRLEAEAIRDSILMISGNLTLTPPKETPVSKLPKQAPINLRFAKVVSRYENSATYRSVYLPILRGFIPSVFQAFDFPEPSETKGLRDVTTVAPQALYLMNNPFVLEQAKGAAKHLLEKPLEDSKRVEVAFEQVYGRMPTVVELKQSLSYVRSSAEEASAAKKEQDSWARLYQALFASAEFLNRT